jgi:hypothetical protein
MIIRLLLLAGLASLASVPSAAQPSASTAWRTDVPCTAGRNPVLRVAGAPDSTGIPGCVRARCVALPDGRRVCACTGDTTIVMRVDRDGETQHEWPADYSMAGSEESLRVLTGDLDEDGRAELVVSEWMDMSNGLGVRYYRLSIFSGADGGRPPVRVDLEDFDPEGSFTRPAGGGPCRLLATQWMELRDDRRGEGMYFTGQWMRYRGDRLEMDMARPVVVRRLLNSFRRDLPRAPLSSFQDRRAEVWSQPLAILPPLAQTRTGSIMRVRDGTVDVALTPHDVQVFEYVGARELYSDQLGALVRTVLVDGATGRPWPRGYTPAPDWLQRAPVTIRTYRDEGRVVTLLVASPAPTPANGSR